MTAPPRRPPSDPMRKVRFREEARDIVAKDRRDRQYGYAVDTAGAIARALERAYRQGFEDAQQPERPAPPPEPFPPDGPLEWVVIPPRPRAAFWSCCLFILGRKSGGARPGRLEPTETERGTPGWRLVVEGFKDLDVIGARTVQPLIKLGLLQPDPAASHRLVITDKGRATWELFVHRGGESPEDLTSF